MSNGPDYELIPVSDEFLDAYEDLCREYGGVEIDKMLMEIRENPKVVSSMMQASYEGFRSYRNDPIRVLFVCCDECIGRGHVDEIDCDDCETIHGENQCDPQQVVKLFTIEDISSIARSS